MASSPSPSSDALPPHSTNVEEELGRVRLALEALYSQQPPTTPDNNSTSNNWLQGRQLADLYLQSFQSTPVSWMVCDLLLQDSAVAAPQVSFFAAQTLHTKCRTDIHQLPPESLPSLRDSLLQHLSKFAKEANASSALLTRLAMAISALSVQMSWMTVVPDLLSSSQQQDQQVLPVLEILRVLPEECASDRLVLIDELVRYQMRDQLVAHCGAVFAFGMSQVQLHKERVYSAMHAWIRHVPVPPQVIADSPMLQQVVGELSFETNQIHNHETIAEVAVDVVVEVLRMYPSHVRHNEGLINKFLPLLLSLQPSFQQANQHGVEDLLRGYTRFVTEMGESYLSYILAQEQHAFAIVTWVLQCSCLGDAEISHMTLHFWYRFVMDLEAMEPFQRRQAVIDAFTPLLHELLNTCVNHLLVFPQDLDDLPEDALDEVHRDRYYVAETVEDCCRLLGGDVVLRRLLQLLQQQCQRFQQQCNTATPNESSSSSWQGIESCLFAIQAIHMFVPLDENECLPFCFQLLPQLPPQIQPLRFTASLLVGKYAPWLANHAVEYMQPLMPFLAQGLSIPKCATAAAVAIKQLCECPNVALGDAVLQLYQQVTAATQPSLELRDELQILEGVCKALTQQLKEAASPESAASSYLSQIVQPIGTRFTQLLSVPTERSSPQHVRQIVAEVERLTVVVRYWKIPNSSTQGTIEIVQSCWSLLDGATQRYPSNIQLAEKNCRLFKHAIRTCGPTGFAPMLDSLLRQLVALFELTRQSPYLYCASICVSDFGHDVAYTAKLMETVESMTRLAVDTLQNNDLDTMIAHPDVVEELFYLMGRVIGYCRSSSSGGGTGHDLLVNTPLLSCLFQLAVVGMRLSHRDANRGTLHFLEAAISAGLNVKNDSNINSNAQGQAVMKSMENVLTQQGQNLVNALVGSLVGELPSYSIANENGGSTSSGSVAGILWKLNLLCGANLMTMWISNAMTSMAVPDQPKMEFLNSGFLANKLTQDEFNIIVRAFASSCDRHRKLSNK